MKPLLLIQFAKWPRIGMVKTRLAATLGDAHALEVHVSLMDAVFTNLISYQSAEVELWLNEFHPLDEISLGAVKGKLEQHHIAYRLQCEGSLGEKMANAIQRSLTGYEKVIIVGSDCPTVDAEYLAAASCMLEAHDIVLGPAEDGGYVLVGASRFDPAVFAGVAWGQGSVLKQTLANAKRLAFSCGLLETTWDVDELSDYQRWLSGAD